MKGINTLLFLLIFTPTIMALQVDVRSFSYSNLQDSYIEIYTYIINPVKDLENHKDRRLESLIIINDGEKIVVAEKYLLQLDSTQSTDVLDFKRFNIGNGNFTIRVEIVDLDDASEYFAHSEEIRINYAPKEAAQSSLFYGFSGDANNLDLIKQNISIEPLVFDFCRNQTELIIYNELYNLESLPDNLYLSIYIYEELGDDEPVEHKKKFKKIKNEAFVPVLEIIPIHDLHSGNYSLEISVIDRNKDILFTKSAGIRVSNAKQDLLEEQNYNQEYKNAWVQEMEADELDYAIKAIFPSLNIISSEMYDYVLDSKDLSVKRYFLFKYWSDQSASNPELIFGKYMEIAKAVDRTFKNHLGYGFESDRGYIFLKYGKPNNIVEVEDEPTAPPYEIWIYNYLAETKQTEVKFLFYNKSLVTNDYSLLHSTCRGEINNPRWEVQLYGSDPSSAVGNSIDSRTVTDGFNRRAREYFSDF